MVTNHIGQCSHANPQTTRPKTAAVRLFSSRSIDMPIVYVSRSFVLGSLRRMVRDLLEKPSTR
jgi:hypothetical protein